jgi:hypothetical protein
MSPLRHALALGALLGAVAATACHAMGPGPAAPRAAVYRAPTWEERHDVMTFAVLPNMARMFQRFDGSADPDMTCATCHGPDAELVHYAMPRGLPALDPTRMPDPDAHNPAEARMAKFMIEEVTPSMARMLGVPEGRPATSHAGGGFSCFNCHPSR